MYQEHIYCLGKTRVIYTVIIAEFVVEIHVVYMYVYDLFILHGVKDGSVDGDKAHPERGQELKEAAAGLPDGPPVEVVVAGRVHERAADAPAGEAADEAARQAVRHDPGEPLRRPVAAAEGGERRHAREAAVGAAVEAPGRHVGHALAQGHGHVGVGVGLGLGGGGGGVHAGRPRSPLRQAPTGYGVGSGLPRCRPCGIYRRHDSHGLLHDTDRRHARVTVTRT